MTITVAPLRIADRVLLGLIPSSEEGWATAAACLKPDKGGWLHVHGNVTSHITSAPNDGRNSSAKRLRKDPRARVDIGRVCDVVAAGRPVAQRFFQGKEKKVDTQIVADITKTACTTSPEERSTIVVITGDADMIPAIEKALQYGWKVEVAIWKGAMSADYKKIEVKSKEGITLKPQLQHLNDHCEDIIFINRKWDVGCNLSKSAVLKVHKKDFDKWHSLKDWFPKDEWCKEVETLANCQFQYDWADFEDSGVSGMFGLILYFKKSGCRREGF
uniref:NYN domain-containing protein n=1 Tax=Amphimedon queenslandica TaxID=400682 RepID=A0A1X7TYT2_AMPQE